MKLQNKIGLGFLVFMTLFITMVMVNAKNKIIDFADEQNAKNATSTVSPSTIQ